MQACGIAGCPSAQGQRHTCLHLLSVVMQDIVHLPKHLASARVPTLGRTGCAGQTPSTAGVKLVHVVEDIVTYSGLCCTLAF